MTTNVENLSRDFLRVCEMAAVDCARTMGQGKRRYSDQVAVEAMRKEMDSIPMRGTVVIGEGERDKAPMLFIGEKVGRGGRDDIEVDIAVAEKYGEIRAALLDQGRDPGPIDLMNASIALLHNMTMVTHNVADYALIPGLTIEDWQTP